MEGCTQSGLAVLLGSASRAPEVLRRKRPLTPPMIWDLHRNWRLLVGALVETQDTTA